jgi:hypothetical protein
MNKKEGYSIKCCKCGAINHIDNYHGSELNQFVDENCRRNMVCNNIDCILWDHDKKKLRIIESKHSMEQVPPSQKALLEFMKGVFDFLNEKGYKSSIRVEDCGKDKHPDKPYKFDICIIRGNHPYKDGVTISVPLENKLYPKMSQSALKKFLELEEKKDKS